MSARVGIEKRIILAAALFTVTLLGVIALSVRMTGIGLPTCLTDVRPFREGKLITQGPKRYELHYVSRMWKFEPADVAILPGSTVDLYLSTADVSHGLQIIGTNVNLMAVPGAVNYARVKFDKAGEYLVVCNEYCGINHHNMAARIHVTERALEMQPEPVHTAAEVAHGRALVEQYDCTSCHSIDGSESVGPTFKGIYRTRRTLADGSVVVINDAYLMESIAKPEAKVVQGFDAMPDPEVAPGDVKPIVEYIETLK